MIEWFVRLILKRRAMGWGLFTLLTAAAILGLTRLEFDDDLRTIFQPNEKQGAASHISDHSIVIVVRGENLFTPETVGLLEEFDWNLRETPGIQTVTSIFDARSLSAENGYHPPLMPAIDSPEKAFARAREEAMRHPAIFRVLLGKSGQTLLFLADPAPDLAQLKDLEPIVEEISRRAEELSQAGGLQVDLAGIPLLRKKIVRASQQDQVIFSIYGAIACVAVAWLMFRRIAVLLITFPIPYIAAVWAVGGMGLAEEPMNIMNNTIIVLVMIIALTDVTHIIFAIRRHAEQGKSPEESTVAGIREVGQACFLTSLTTAIAFLSLMFSSNTMVVRYGITCALGVMLVFVAVILFVPLLSGSFLGRHILPKTPHRPSLVHRSRIYRQLADFVVAYPWLIIISGAALIAVTIAACFQIRADYRYRENLRTDTRQWQIVEFLDNEFGGSQPLYVEVRLPQHLSPDEAGLARVLKDLHEELPRENWTAAPFSLYSILQSLGLEDHPRPVETLLEDVSEAQLQPIADLGRNSATLVLPLKDAGSLALTPVLADIRESLDRLRLRHTEAEINITGLTACALENSQRMIRELIISLFAAAFIVFLIIGFTLKSARLGLISILPNLLPIFLTAGTLVLLGHPLQYVSAMAMTLTLGVSVDDSIHFLFRYRMERRRHDNETAVRRSIETVGVALFTSTLIMIVGLFALFTSQLPTIQFFGLLIIASLIAALIADLILLPAILLVMSRKQR